ncbi:TIGR03086 family metal-binding protein [Nocardia sp. NPDC051570]|uniref:TIGR03086 family metal-binding protein n=1 Tax=Nocardia sp. NPDC051570 TaxID=3364324 RepID=UPI0037A79FB1
MSDLLRLDATALALLGHDVATVSESELGAPTPCTGWTVRDLIEHMNSQHESVNSAALGPLDDHADDPRDDFARITGRWLAAAENSGGQMRLRLLGRATTERVLGIHFVDMLVHRWDLARAVGRECPVPDRLLAAALPLARANTAPGSVLNGPGGMYLPSLSEDSASTPMDAIVALLGRDPMWQRP